MEIKNVIREYDNIIDTIYDARLLSTKNKIPIEPIRFSNSSKEYPDTECMQTVYMIMTALYDNELTKANRIDKINIVREVDSSNYIEGNEYYVITVTGTSLHEVEITIFEVVKP